MDEQKGRDTGISRDAKTKNPRRERGQWEQERKNVEVPLIFHRYKRFGE